MIYFIIVVAVIVLSIWWQRRTIGQWIGIAAELNLQFTRTGRLGCSGRIEGTYQDFKVVAIYYADPKVQHAKLEHIGTTKRTCTEVITRFNQPMPEGFKIYTETAVLSKVGKFLGTQDIQTQDPAFDSAFMIKGEPEENIKRLLSPPTRAAILRYNELYEVYIDEHEIKHTLYDFIHDAKDLRRILDAQHEVAKALCA